MIQLPVGASLLAMVVNDNAGNLTPSSVMESIASRLAPTGAGKSLSRGLTQCRRTSPIPASATGYASSTWC
ncbi:hypothetical protein DKY63_00345 [Pseudomonas putida]|uniref:Uncharacterized protein n=1 Tax=Pseudomonas putida TaxID=303 RepID=A0A2Z4REQ1_PSEPU|nr:hypothetical protein DKY63_00345 [Pseudomonas putida]